MFSTRTFKWPVCDRAQITCNTSSAYRVQHAVCHLVRRDSSAVKFDRVEIAFILALSLLAETINIKEGRKPELPEKTADDELQKMPHTKTRTFKPKARPKPTL